MSEKTEKPTPKKIRDLKKKGDVTKSEEVLSAAQS
ncbi:TPA: EscU/YscU/HrcU family type III secretion system export apparatus switch protein, partial [Salmonella enterica subsp. salamae serovar 42:g,t:-]